VKDALEEFIQSNRDHFDTKAPDPAVLSRVLKQLQQKEKLKPGGIVIPFRVIRWAAAVLALIGFGATFWILQKKDEPVAVVKINSSAQQQQFSKLRAKLPKQAEPAAGTEVKAQESASPTLAEQDLKIRKQTLLAKLRAQHLNAQKQVIFAELNDMDSPANRIKAVSRAHNFYKNGHDIVDALIERLNTDPNANVRLAALDGLNQFYRENYVRKKLLASLKKQQDPVVQIALINLLTNIRESGILEELERMSKDEKTQQIVKDCAYSGIIRLQSS
jgi:hypothetical protein